MNTPTFTVLISPLMYRLNLERPTFLPRVLSNCLKSVLPPIYAAQKAVWEIEEDETAQGKDFALLSSVQLSSDAAESELDGCIIGALCALEAVSYPDDELAEVAQASERA